MEASVFEVAVYTFFVTAHGVLFDVLPEALSRGFYLFGIWRVPVLVFSLLPVVLLLGAAVLARQIGPRHLLYAALAVFAVSFLQPLLLQDLYFSFPISDYLRLSGNVITGSMLAAAVLLLEAFRADCDVRVSGRAYCFVFLASGVAFFNPYFFSALILQASQISTAHPSPLPHLTANLGAAMMLSAIVLILPVLLGVLAFTLPRWIKLTLQRAAVLVMAGLCWWFSHNAYFSFMRM